jgi:hypothetical protein
MLMAVQSARPVKDMVRTILAVGHDLIQAKKELGHGEFVLIFHAKPHKIALHGRIQYRRYALATGAAKRVERQLIEHFAWQSELGAVERGMVVAAANLCCRTATASRPER